MAEKMAIMGRKLGMTRIFASDGSAVAVTVIQAGPCPVIQVKNEEKDGYNAIQIAFKEAKAKHLTKAEIGHLAKADKGLFRHLKEIRLSSSSELKVGDDINVSIFARGEYVTVSGRSIGKGYQGVMKRWNFAGGKDSHGVEKVHRSGGSIGMHTFPGKVFKNKKMAGHMGDRKVSVCDLQIVDVMPEDNVILIKGAVPGSKNALVVVRKQ